MLERERNDAMPFSFLSPCPLPPALPCLLASISPPPSGSWDERAAAMIAWRVPFPSCLPVADLPVSASHRCRLVGRRGERAVLALCSVVAICPVFVSLPRRLMPLAACFDEMPLVPSIRFLSLLVSFLISEGVSLCLPCRLAPDVFFLCFFCLFASFSGVLCLLDLSPRPSRLIVSSSRLVGRLGAAVASSCAACLMGSRW